MSISIREWVNDKLIDMMNDYLVKLLYYFEYKTFLSIELSEKHAGCFTVEVECGVKNVHFYAEIYNPNLREENETAQDIFRCICSYMFSRNEIWILKEGLSESGRNQLNEWMEGIKLWN